MNLRNVFYLSTFLILALVLAACSTAEETSEPVSEATVVVEASQDESMDEAPMDEEMESMDEELQSIAAIASGNDDFSTLVTALDAAGLVDTFAGDGSFTVFAPTNAAFAALPEGTLDALLADPQGALTDILTYHVVGDAVLAEQVVTLDSADTLNGAPIAIAVVDDGVVLNDTVNVTATDIMASNGVIHVIDAVLLPPTDEMMEDEMMEEPTQTIAEIAVANDDFSTLVTALEAAGLVDTFAGEGAFTVFAPTNDAFAALGDTLNDVLADPQGLLTDILTYHVVDGVVLAEQVVTLDSADTLNGAPIAIAVVDGSVVLNDSTNVVATDIKATNGVIHVIDAVLLPSTDEMMEDETDAMMEEPTQSIAEIAVSNDDFSTLVTALTAANLVETLSGEGEFTVFAPTNDAFAALGDTLNDVLADPEGLLTQILLYHVADGIVPAEKVVTLDEALTLQGDAITIEVTDDGVILNDTANVITTDIKATNGIVHVIDAVLLPPTP
ncbi:MAG: fasciclin domain-containing protein [Anaerolineae bacterium]|nr:fasciclin domain-containing protein [Anaerolineae bacterium]